MVPDEQFTTTNSIDGTDVNSDVWTDARPDVTVAYTFAEVRDIL